MILFKAKTLDTGEWVEGYYVKEKGYDMVNRLVTDHKILDEWGSGEHIDPNTLGQYIGKEDKEGKRIFTGDLIGSDTSKSIGLIKDMWTWEWLKIEMENGEMKDGKTAMDRFIWLKDMKGFDKSKITSNIHNN